VSGSALLVLIVTYTPFLQPFFDTVSLSLTDWLVMIPFILLASIAAELIKVYIRNRAARMVAAAV